MAFVVFHQVFIKQDRRKGLGEKGLVSIPKNVLVSTVLVTCHGGLKACVVVIGHFVVDVVLS